MTLLRNTVLFTYFLSLFHLCTAAVFKVNIQDDGQYSIAVDNKTWLTSAPTFFNKDGQRWSPEDLNNTMVLQKVENITGGDFLQPWVETQFTYTFGNSSSSVMTAIRTFKDKNKVLFTQKYITAADNTSIGGMTSFNKTVSGFPSFRVTDADEQLGFLSFGGYMVGDTDKTTGVFSSATSNINDGMSGGPLSIFNKAGHALIISPYDNYMAASIWHDEKPGGHVSWGIMGGVNYIPANFTYRTLLTFDDTINQAFFQWGNNLIERFDIFNTINRAKNQSADVSLNYLGYWTDNGAYYYYKPEVNKTFEDTIIDVKAYAQNTSIPYKYVQLDSWWYPKDTAHKAVISWTALPSVFPNGLKNLSEATDWNFVAHNRYWSNETPYAKQNNGSFNWIIGQYGSLPNDRSFWSFLFKQAKAWGLKVYEQDWLNIQTQYMPELQTSLTLGRDWLTQMGDAAAEQGLTIQYCMAMPRHTLQSLEIPSVTQARVSDDYLYKRPDQWKIGVTSLFANAVKLYPYKDTFWTTTEQPGNPFNKTEPFPALEAAVSSLSKGPVGPGDMIGGTDRDLLMKCCSSDGMLLKPSRPAQAIDKQILTDAFTQTSKRVGEIWMSQSFIPTNKIDKEYGILFAADVNGSLSVGIGDLHFNVLTEGVYYPYRNASLWKYFNASTTIDLTGCTKKDFCLYYFSPFLNSTSVTAILGEWNKWIPMSQQRISNIQIDGPSVKLSLTGAKMEPVSVWYLVNNKLQMAQCVTSGRQASPDNCPMFQAMNSVATIHYHDAQTVLTVHVCTIAFALNLL